MTMNNVKLVMILLVAAMFAACETAEKESYQETESGLKYLFHEEVDGEEPEMNNILSMNMIYRVEDSVLFDSRDTGMPMFLELIEPRGGDIYEGFSMMTVGDSASFKVDAEQFFLETAEMPEMPPFIEPGSELVFDVRMLESMNEEEFAEEQQRMMEEQMEADTERAEQEEGLMMAYIEEEGITADPTESGLYYVQQEPGDGPEVQSGDMIAVHYEGRLLDGTVFDSSHDRDEPIEFTVGQGQVIPGWDEGVAMMSVGEEAKLVIPSHLAYGDQGAGQVIPPHSTLVFEVEIIEIVDPS